MPASASRSPVWLLCLGLLMVGTGGAALWLAHSVESRDAAQRGWPVVQGQLLLVRIVSRPSLRGSGFEAGVQFRYQVAGRSYEGWKLSPAPASGSVEELKTRLAGLLNDPHAVRQEHRTAAGYEFIHRPLGQNITVSYDPANPADAAVLLGGGAVTQLTGARICGWLILGAGGLVLGVFGNAYFVVRRNRPKLSARIPTQAELAGFHEAIARALQEIDRARESGERDDALNQLESTLRELHRDGAEALRRRERLGFNRWLSGELDFAARSSACARVLDAAEEVERVRERFHSGVPE